MKPRRIREQRKKEWRSRSRSWRQGDWDYVKSGWPKDKQRRKGGCLFLRMTVMFGLFIGLIMGGFAAAALFTTRALGGDGTQAALFTLGACIMGPLFLALAFWVGTRAFRNIATPLADVMSAADTVAEGDFSARVPESQRGEFGQLARSFNRMAGELELAEVKRRNLTADVAHELRTPLHIIQGNLEGILDRVYQPTDAHIQATLEETEMLSRLVEDLLTLALAESGELLLVKERVDVAALLADVQTSFSGQAEAAGLELLVKVEDLNGPLFVVGDTGRLNQVLTNLVANAIRHTPAGGEIRLSAASDASGVILTVSDNGAGIPADELPFIFDRLWRSDPARTHQAGQGAGLGLAISRQLVRAHGGSVAVESEEGQGATFVIRLPGPQPDDYL